MISTCRRAAQGELNLVGNIVQVLEAFQNGVENTVCFLTEGMTAQQLEMLASLMDQKKVVVTAERAALTLHKADPRSVWRRLLVIASEDIGIGSTAAVVETARLASDPKLRGRQGGEVAAIFHVCQRLAESAKDRCSDFLISAAAHDLGLETARGACGSIPVSRRLEFVADQTRPLPERAVAAWYASGMENGWESRVGKGDFDGLMKVYADLGAPGPLLDAVGRKIGIPFGRSKWCPVAALERWLQAAGIDDGPLFRRVDRHARVSAEQLSAERGHRGHAVPDWLVVHREPRRKHVTLPVF